MEAKSDGACPTTGDGVQMQSLIVDFSNLATLQLVGTRFIDNVANNNARHRLIPFVFRTLPAGQTYILAGGEVTTLNELIRIVAEVAGVRPPGLHLPVLPVWVAGAACELICAPFGIEPPLYRRRVDFFTKSRAFDIARARSELGYAPQVSLRDGIRRTLEWYRSAGWL